MSELRANIHHKAKIGKNVTIEPFSTIYGDVEIGEADNQEEVDRHIERVIS